MKTRAHFPLIAVAALVAASDAGATNAVVTNCTEAGLTSALSTVDGSGGGTITFNCGTATITFTSYKQVANAVVIDGGGTITFDGGNTSPFFQSFFSATFVLRRLTLQHGIYAGGIRALENFGTLVLDRVRVVNNNSSTRGPVLNTGTLFVRASTFSGNTASSSTDGNGGAIQNSSGALDVEGSTFSANSAGHYGGAIHSNSSMSITNSTFAGNASASGGGAIYQTAPDGSPVASTMMYSTIFDNTAPFGAGVYSNDPAVLTVSRSIIAGNADGNCDGSSTALLSGGYNVWFGATSCSFSATGDGAGNPLLGALANNGGPTQTLMPGSGSAAVDRIPHAACVEHYDQRGYARTPAVLPGSSNCDSGAVEVNSSNDLIFYYDFD